MDVVRVLLGAMCVVWVNGCTRAAVATPPGRDAISPAPVVPSAREASAEPMMMDGPFVRAETPVEAGKYLVAIVGCGDCHTAAHDATIGRKFTEIELAGNPVGYRGPWGTTYAANLRLVTQHMTEDKWVVLLKTHDGRPPMPWGDVQRMNERDLRAMYRYIRSLGPAGKAAPRFVPPGREPVTPYVDLTPQHAATP